ncbi:arginase [Pseudozyma hubeiensis SY62]|uniref:Arginase n=1 Tax=Pseudozyma hubeiensis (strain SY62) TaxID=1305764 RepID=R9P0G6_PSEHS|nr:arginase [Pseudozyma hubeiensis SY62]GAC94693.1 arginase [Pseudozyma hubeiensis SY62]
MRRFTAKANAVPDEGRVSRPGSGPWWEVYCTKRPVNRSASAIEPTEGMPAFGISSDLLMNGDQLKRGLSKGIRHTCRIRTASRFVSKGQHAPHKIQRLVCTPPWHVSFRLPDTVTSRTWVLSRCSSSPHLTASGLDQATAPKTAHFHLLALLVAVACWHQDRIFDAQVRHKLL